MLHLHTQCQCPLENMKHKHHCPPFTDTETEERDINPISKRSSSRGLLPFFESQMTLSALFFCKIPSEQRFPSVTL